MLGGIVGLWLINLLLSVGDIQVPINIFTVLLVAFLGFPGAIILTVFQFIGI
jgi:inhibitor of the pro-sigma K processing machinery